MTMGFALTPVYLGTRYRSRFSDMLVLWYKPLAGGRRRLARRDCPECADGKVEVGGDSSVAECLSLAEVLIRKERGSKAAEKLAARFADEVIAYLPRDCPWSIDACTIRTWVDEQTPVRATWRGTAHDLPPEDHLERRRQIMYPGPRGALMAEPARLDDDQAAAMGDVLARIDGDAF